VIDISGFAAKRSADLKLHQKKEASSQGRGSNSKNTANICSQADKLDINNCPLRPCKRCSDFSLFPLPNLLSLFLLNCAIHSDQISRGYTAYILILCVPSLDTQCPAAIESIFAISTDLRSQPTLTSPLQ
jgi:hypothetical protein